MNLDWFLVSIFFSTSAMTNLDVKINRTGSKVTAFNLNTVERSEDIKKVQIGNDQEMAQSERNSHSINRGVGKN